MSVVRAMEKNNERRISKRFERDLSHRAKMTYIMYILIYMAIIWSNQQSWGALCIPIVTEPYLRLLTNYAGATGPLNNYTPIWYSHDQSWLAWSNPMTIDQSTSPRQTNRHQLNNNNIVRELQVYIAILTLPTSRFAWSIFISDSQSQRLLITPTSSITQYRHNGTQSNGSAEKNIVPNHGTCIISHWLNEHSTINQLTSPCTHTHST